MDVSLLAREPASRLHIRHLNRSPTLHDALGLAWQGAPHQWREQPVLPSDSSVRLLPKHIWGFATAEGAFQIAQRLHSAFWLNDGRDRSLGDAHLRCVHLWLRARLWFIHHVHFFIRGGWVSAMRAA